jgi:hypothetical protein
MQVAVAAAVLPLVVQEALAVVARVEEMETEATALPTRVAAAVEAERMVTRVVQAVAVLSLFVLLLLLHALRCRWLLRVAR